MDLSIIQNMIPNIAGLLNVEPATVLFWGGIICMGCNLAGRFIPDDAQGWLGVVRQICKFLGAYAENRVTSGVKTSDVVKHVAEREILRQAPDGLDDIIEEPLADNVLELKTPAFPGLLEKD